MSWKNISLVLGAVLTTSVSASAQEPKDAFMHPPGGIANRDFKEMSNSLEAVPGEFDLFAEVESQCGPVDDSQHVEFYDGALGPSEAFVDHEESSTGQIQWNANFADLFNGPGDDPGNVAGKRWCSGTLIAEDLFLTAAHCIRVSEGMPSWPTYPRTPSRSGITGRDYVKPAELAKLMHVNFNYQLARETERPRVADEYPILELVESGDDRPAPGGGHYDYAILRLGKGAAGQLPGARYRVADFDASEGALRKVRELTIVQHPKGDPKKLEAGLLHGVDDWQIQYDDLDTFGGASGSGIIADSGAVIGVHTNGGCRQFTGGYNFGVSLHAVSTVSEIIK
ncbi:trypsin-like serine peptidase [Pelagibius marinus]|uniref:trypsin-like serine peptidase n=1 Tax=Pelagibius marinus TaxID=2762760 RepID=UPI0018721958|nr:serine protease [Pelagibius marinus]